ncbi:hypothetical protein FRACYDRAFT_254834 [Fragilariopsis cylindrus CCMP1102]|uniref:Tyrosine specific protein phosphatases domain-containing protein n=1 Tax=Fragilariopsis cylindrus CCMP1102 TaxID=635003 RepID=A0A1E7EKD2_9STRA|nr:hypothetical protein FRACYDRAFT_254834 [Fragilariopsis cylindrus CCMP1102]|eukprot:OEU06375.1 hypothetical protein FRACYDRAFT_254834 [Fragilariopsis cylindrus CCMP1102]
MTMTMTSSSSRIRNFRPASGFIIALDDETDDKSAVSSSSATTRLASTVYRCGSTDVLGREQEEDEADSSFTTDDDQIVFQHAGLIIDLRSPAERNEKDAQRWMNEYSSSVVASVVASSSIVSPAGLAQRRPIHVFTIPIDDDEESSSVIAELHEKIFEDDDIMNSQRRYVIRLDILNRKELVRYIQNNWLSSSLLTKNNSSAATSSLITEEFNKRGLAGLNEAILETKSGQLGLCRALQIMTIYREAIIMKKKKKKNNNTQTNDDDTSIVIHCVQGKDRTGMLVMLMQLLMGTTIISDNEIIEDYYRSNNNAAVNIKSKHRRRNEGSATATASSAAAAAIVVVGGGGNDNSSARSIKMDKRVFSGTNREAMISTLEGLRRRYGHNDNDDEGEGGSTTRFGGFDRTIPRYFDLIGFSDSWRKRFRNVFIKKKNTNTGNNIRRSRLKTVNYIAPLRDRTSPINLSPDHARHFFSLKKITDQVATRILMEGEGTAKTNDDNNLTQPHVKQKSFPLFNYDDKAELHQLTIPSI